MLLGVSAASLKKLSPTTQLIQAFTTARFGLASSAYTNRTQGTEHPAVSTTPRNLTPQQRYALDSAIRVDQAGEVAANWIYRGQLFVLGRDLSAGPLIQVRLQSDTLPGLLTNVQFLIGNVGPGEETSRRDEQNPVAAPSTTNDIFRSGKGSWFWIGRLDGTHGQGSSNGMHRGG